MSFELIASLTSMVRHRACLALKRNETKAQHERLMEDHRDLIVFTHISFSKTSGWRKYKGRKICFNYPKDNAVLQYCEICTNHANQSCSRGRYVVELSAIIDICSVMGRGPSKILERNLSPEAISEHFCILIGETLMFFVIYMRKRDKVDFFRYLHLNQDDVASVRPVFQEARFGHFLSRNKRQALIKQWNEP